VIDPAAFFPEFRDKKGRAVRLFRAVGRESTSTTADGKSGGLCRDSRLRRSGEQQPRSVTPAPLTEQKPSRRRRIAGLRRIPTLAPTDSMQRFLF